MLNWLKQPWIHSVNKGEKVKRLALSFMMLLLLLGTMVVSCPGSSDSNGNGNDYVPSPPPTTPAEFSVSNITLTPSEVEAGTEVVVSVDVANTGGSEGTYAATLEVNGEAVETKNIAVAAGATETASFQLIEDTPGIYTTSLDGLTATLKVGVPLIVFVSDRDGDLEIYVMNPDGSNVVRLTYSTAQDNVPSWALT